jgi:thioredoxin-like negative regulator of GroEL
MHITDIDDSNTGALETLGKIVLIEFYNNRCPTCRAVEKTVEQFAAERESDITVCTVNTDKSPELVRRFSIMSVPSFLVLRDGGVIGRASGVLSLGELRELVLSEAAVT